MANVDKIYTCLSNFFVCTNTQESFKSPALYVNSAPYRPEKIVRLISYIP